MGSMEGIKDGEESLVKMWGMFNRKDIIVQSALQIGKGDQVFSHYFTSIHPYQYNAHRCGEGGYHNCKLSRFFTAVSLCLLHN